MQLAIRVQSYFNVELPKEDVDLLKNKFNISDSQVRTTVTDLIKKAIQEKTYDDKDVFSQEECRELEEDLKGLGYI